MMSLRSCMAEKGTGWHLSLFRIVWMLFSIQFAGMILFWTLKEADLPALPYPVFAFISLIPDNIIIAFAVLMIVSSLLVMIGWRTRAMQWITFALAFLLFFHSASLYHNHDAFFLFVLFFLCFASTDRFYSFDARKKKKQLLPEHFYHWQKETISLLPQKMILLQLSFLYFFAAANKLHPVWFTRWSSSEELIFLSRNNIFDAVWMKFLEWNVAPMLMGFTIVLLFFLSFGIFSARKYPLIVLVGLLMHFSFDLVLPIIQFSLMSSAILLLAVFPSENRFVRKLVWDRSVL